MGSSAKVRRFVLLGVSGILVFVLTAFASASTNQQDLDLSTVILRLDDLPAGFAPLSGSDLTRLESALDIYQGAMQGASDAKIQNITGFRTSDPLNSQIVVSGIVAPLSPAEQLIINQQLANPDAAIEQLSRGLGGGEASALSGAEDIGQSRLGFSVTIGSVSMRMDYVVARRGPVIIEVAYMYLESQTPLTSAVELARILDDRAIDVVGGETAPAFRTAGPLVPELTTYIPTPLDVSTRPSVIGTNLFLAALLMLPFAVAAEIFTRILGEHEEALRRRVRVVDWVARMQMKLESVSGSRLKRAGLQDAVKVLGVIFFYGLVFSLLDRTWNPFTIKGLILLGSMMLAYGVVGIADDIFQWRAIRRWGLEADLTVRPTNFLLAAFSTTASRLFTVVPGLMFGTPEALRTDENQFDESKKRSLLNISARTLIAVALIMWIPTALTGLLQRLDLAEGAKNVIGGVEAILLVVFAVALENLFVQMLGMPGSLGHAVKQRSRWGWIVGLGGVAFLFYHTLINPRGELADAIQEANVLVFFGIAVAFMIFAFGVRLYLGRRERMGPAIPAVRVKTGPMAGPRQMGIQQTVGIAPAMPAAIPDIEKPVIIIPMDDCKKCPVCGEMIKAEARLCRFCRATFTVAVKGYCTESHEVVDVNEEGKCVLCGKEPKDIHVESRLLKVPSVIPTSANVNEPPRPERQSPKEDGNLKQCPACGQTIKAEAVICRFCRARFEVHERGYCLTDHAVVDVKEGKCIQCGEAAQDVHFESQIVETVAPRAKPASAVALPQRQVPALSQPTPATPQPFRIATPSQQADHMSLILSWCERNKDRPIKVNVISKFDGRERTITTAHGKVREIEEHPGKKGIFRIEFDSRLKVNSEYDVIMLGYEISAVTETGEQLVIQKGPNQRFELAAGAEPPKVESAPKADWPEISGYSSQSCASCGGKGSITCKSCEGYGKVLVLEPALRCPVCHGNGYLIEQEIYLGPMCASCSGTGWQNALKLSEAVAQARKSTQVSPPAEVAKSTPTRDETVSEQDLGQKCPKCNGALNERRGSPVSPSINTYSCAKCGWQGFRCGKTGCDGYLKPQEVGYPNSVRYNCVKCGWTGMGPRM